MLLAAPSADEQRDRVSSNNTAVKSEACPCGHRRATPRSAATALGAREASSSTTGEGTGRGDINYYLLVSSKQSNTAVNSLLLLMRPIRWERGAEMHSCGVRAISGLALILPHSAVQQKTQILSIQFKFFPWIIICCWPAVIGDGRDSGFCAHIWELCRGHIFLWPESCAHTPCPFPHTPYDDSNALCFPLWGRIAAKQSTRPLAGQPARPHCGRATQGRVRKLANLTRQDFLSKPEREVAHVCF